MTKELQTQTHLQNQKANECVPVCDVKQIFEALLLPFGELTDESVKDLIMKYKVDLNNRGATWNQIDTETDIAVLSALLFDWMEHLKSPILDR